MKFPVKSLIVDTKPEFKAPTKMRYENGFLVTTKDKIVPM